MADKCRFIQPNAASSPSDSLGQGSEKKRSRSRDDEGDPEVSEPEDDDDDVELAAMGYAAGPLLESLTIDSKVGREWRACLTRAGRRDFIADKWPETQETAGSDHLGSSQYLSSTQACHGCSPLETSDG